MIRVAIDEDADAIAELLAEPMPGPIRLALHETSTACRPCDEPDRRHHAIVDVQDGRITGHGARTVRRVHLGEGVRPAGYLHGLRRDSRRAGAGRSIATALTALTAARRPHEHPVDLTAILRANHHARRVLTRLPGAPRYRHVTGFRTLIIAQAVLPTDPPVRPITAADIPAAQSMVEAGAGDWAVAATVQTGNGWLVAVDCGAVVGVVRAVDRRQERPVVVDGYAPWLGLTRPAINLASRLLRRPLLPPPAAALDCVWAAHLAASEPPVVRGLLAAVAACCDASLVGWGLGDAHPLRPHLDRLPGWRIDSDLFLVGNSAEPPRRWISPEAAWL